jgi:hypothetical protein
MKTKSVFAVTSLAFVASASAYTVSITNFDGADSTAVPILDNTGTPIAAGAGFIGAGTFAAAPDSLETAKGLVPFGTGATGFTNGLGGEAGFFFNQFNAPIPFGTTDAPVGEDLYIVFGNGSTLADSTQLAVFDAGQVFGTESAAGSGGNDVVILDSALTPENLVFGNVANDVDLGLGVIFSEGIQLSDGTVVPEPSTSLLAALAGLALAARRRR